MKTKEEVLNTDFKNKKLVIESDGTAMGTRVFIDGEMQSGITDLKFEADLDSVTLQTKRILLSTK